MINLNNARLTRSDIDELEAGAVIECSNRAPTNILC